QGRVLRAHYAEPVLGGDQPLLAADDARQGRRHLLAQRDQRLLRSNRRGLGFGGGVRVPAQRLANGLGPQLRRRRPLVRRHHHLLVVVGAEQAPQDRLPVGGLGVQANRELSL